jgi:hypothetical protein
MNTKDPPPVRGSRYQCSVGHGNEGNAYEKYLPCHKSQILSTLTYPMGKW